MASIIRVDELHTRGGVPVAELTSNGALQLLSGLQLPNFAEADRPQNAVTGVLIFNTTSQSIELWNGAAWVTVFSSGIGTSAQSPAESASQIKQLNPNATSGLYYIKPPGYNGAAEQVIVDFDGSYSGITDDQGPWVRIRYAQSYYSRADAWRGQSGLTNPAAESTTAFSGVFDYEQPYNFIDKMLDNSTEVRQRFESWGYGSVGWTYQGTNGYNEARGFDNKNYTRWGEALTHVGASGVPRISGISHSVTSISGPFNNPTANGTDPTDANDNVWRVGVFYFKYDQTAGRKPLPIRGMYNGDVDGASEQRYFPFRDGEAENGVNSDTWIKN